MDQHRRGTHPNGPLCCHSSHLAAARSISQEVACWSGGGTALCVWCSCGDLFGGAVHMVRWAARRVYTLQLQLQLTNILYMTLKQYPCIRTVCTAGVNWYVSVNSPYLCVLSRSPCAYDSLAVCITRHMSNKLPTCPFISLSVSLQEPLHCCQVEGEADGLPLSFKLGAHISKQLWSRRRRPFFLLRQPFK